MAFVTDAPSAERRSIFSAISDFFFAVGQAHFVARGMDARMREIERLEAKSDAELEKMGLTRDSITSHVFRDIIHI